MDIAFWHDIKIAFALQFKKIGLTAKDCYYGKKRHLESTFRISR